MSDPIKEALNSLVARYGTTTPPQDKKGTKQIGAVLSDHDITIRTKENGLTKETKIPIQEIQDAISNETDPTKLEQYDRVFKQIKETDFQKFTRIFTSMFDYEPRSINQEINQFGREIKSIFSSDNALVDFNKKRLEFVYDKLNNSTPTKKLNSSTEIVPMTEEDLTNEILKNPEKLKSIPEEWKNNSAFKSALDVEIDINPKLAQHLPYSSEEDKQLTQSLVKGNIMALTYAPEGLKNDKKFILSIIEEKPRALLYLPDSIKNDKEFIEEAIQKHQDAKLYTPEAVSKEREQVLSEIEKDRGALRNSKSYLQSYFSNDQTFRNEAIERTPKVKYGSLSESEKFQSKNKDEQRLFISNKISNGNPWKESEETRELMNMHFDSKNKPKEGIDKINIGQFRDIPKDKQREMIANAIYNNFKWESDFRIGKAIDIYFSTETVNTVQ